MLGYQKMPLRVHTLPRTKKLRMRRGRGLTSRFGKQGLRVLVSGQAMIALWGTPYFLCAPIRTRGLRWGNRSTITLWGPRGLYGSSLLPGRKQHVRLIDQLCNNGRQPGYLLLLCMQLILLSLVPVHHHPKIAGRGSKLGDNITHSRRRLHKRTTTKDGNDPLWCLHERAVTVGDRCRISAGRQSHVGTGESCRSRGYTPCTKTTRMVWRRSRSI